MTVSTLDDMNNNRFSTALYWHVFVDTNSNVNNPMTCDVNITYHTCRRQLFPNAKTYCPTFGHSNGHCPSYVESQISALI